MARPLRIEYEGAIYHVTSRGNERRKTFFSRRDYEKFLEYIDEAREKFGVIVHCYVLMSNHYHLLIETPEGNLSKAMHHINSSYTTYLNIKKKRSGHLFQGRFKSIVVDKDSYLLELSRYLHLNPVRANMVTRPEEYPYSSYGAYIKAVADTRVATATILEMLAAKPGDARRKYKSFVENALGHELESPFGKVYGGIVLGNSEFIKEVLQKIGDEQLEREETSYRRPLRASYMAEDVLKSVGAHYGLTKDEITSGGRNAARKSCLYLLKKHTSCTNREIGVQLGMGAAAVAKAYQRFGGEMESDRRLRKEIEGIEKEMSRVKG